ncbi:hypothetical protein BH11BAC4_BH11BAC4_14920 [soil metagenome]
MEQSLINAIEQLTKSVNDLNESIKKPMRIDSNTDSSIVDLKGELFDLKTAIKNLILQMQRTD